MVSPSRLELSGGEADVRLFAFGGRDGDRIFSLGSIASSTTNHKFTNAFLLLFFKFESCNDHATDVYKPQRCYSVHGF